jgi:hypothetical protein
MEILVYVVWVGSIRGRLGIGRDLRTVQVGVVLMVFVERYGFVK